MILRLPGSTWLGRLAAALLGPMLLAGAWAQAPHTAYQGPFRPDPALRGVAIEPVWRDRLDSPTAVVTDTAVVYLRDGRLVATELAGGWQQWSYGSGLTGPLLRVEDLVIVAEGSWVTALDAADGALRWQTAVTELPVRYLSVSGQALVVGSGDAHLALDLATGSVTHAFEVAGVGAPAHVGRDLIVYRAHHGEPNVAWFHAFDPRSGEELWRGRGWLRLLAVSEGRVYLLNQPAPGAGARFSISVVDAPSGRRLDHWQYGFGDHLDGWHAAEGAAVLLTGGALYVTDVTGARLYRFPRGGAEQPEGEFDLPGGSFRAGPHRGLLFFEGPGNRLVALRERGASPVEYLFAGGELSRLDLVGERAYVGRTDGAFVAVDLRDARVRYLLQTDGLGFGPTLLTGPYVVVQGSAEVLVLEDVE